MRLEGQKLENLNSELLNYFPIIVAVLPPEPKPTKNKSGKAHKSHKVALHKEPITVHKFDDETMEDEHAGMPVLKLKKSHIAHGAVNNLGVQEVSLKVTLPMCGDNDKYVSRSRCQCVAAMMNISLKVTLPMCDDNDKYKSQGHAANV